MNGQKADMAHNDPPYGMKKENEGVLNDNLNYNDLLDFNNSFEKDFVSAWSAKNARLKGLPNDTKRIRIGGFGNRTKRNGFRVVVAEVVTDETSEAFKFFHVLRVDEKADKEDYLSDAELKEVTLLQSEMQKKYPKSYLTWV